MNQEMTLKMIQRGQRSKRIERLFDERCFEANEPGRREDDTDGSSHLCASAQMETISAEDLLPEYL